MDFSRFFLAPRPTLARRGAHFSLLLGGALLLLAPPVSAQKAAPAPAPTLELAPPRTASDIGILLFVIDELPAPGTLRAAPTLPPVAPNPLLPGAITPAAPDTLPDALPNPAPAAITPAQFLPALTGAARPFWIAPAQKKKRKDDDLFKLEPEFSRPTLPGRNAKPEAPQTDPVLPDAPAQLTPAPPVSLVPLGRAQTAAIPLRRSLLAFGWSDVLLATPEATPIRNALTDGRLTARTLQDLKIALADVIAPGTTPSPEATARANQAAARIGQALGYRAVAAFYVAPPTTQNGAQSAGFSLLLTDTARETGEPILFDETGNTPDSLRDAGASTAAALIDKTLRNWPPTSDAERLELAARHLSLAKARVNIGDFAGAQDELNQAIALDNSKAESYVLLGDLLANTNAAGAATAYRRAVELDARDGATLSKIAIAYANSTVPDWPRALDAGRKAVAAGFESAALRVAMATAEYGRADLFRRADRIIRAEDAESEAKTYLERALELSPDDPSAVRLLARRLVETRRFNEATQTLDRVAPRYPNDLEIQTQYAAALAGQTGREEDAFVASSRVWKLSGVTRVDVDALKYRALAQGFDARLYNIGKSVVQLTTGVANAALPREDALNQLTKLKEDMEAAEKAIEILRAPATVGIEGVAARQFAASLLTQALEQQQIYLETGQSLARLRGAQLYGQAVAQLNTARNSR